jgi:hypothetical protein
LKLEIELVPKPLWGLSLHRLLPKETWNAIRNDFIATNGRKCGICGETEGTMSLHEVWNYDDEKRVQKFEKFILLCGMCDHVKHMGLAGILAKEGKLDLGQVIEHFCKVNNCTREDLKKHMSATSETWKKRSKCQWKQDFGTYANLIRERK